MIARKSQAGRLLDFTDSDWFFFGHPGVLLSTHYIYENRTCRPVRVFAAGDFPDSMQVAEYFVFNHRRRKIFVLRDRGEPYAVNSRQTREQ